MSLSDYLTLSQILFYISFSVAFLAFGSIFVSIIYYLLRITRHLERIANNVEIASDEVRNNIIKIIEALAKLPIVSSFFKRKHGKGR